MHTEALFKGPTLFRIFTRKYHWQQNDLKSIFPKKNWVFWREIITRTINNLKYICENQHLPGKVFIKKLMFFLCKSLGGKFYGGKKGLHFWIVSCVNQKIFNKFFWREKSCFVYEIFFSSKAMDIFCFNTRLCSNSQKFFSFRQPSIRKKKEKR